MADPPGTPLGGPLLAGNYTLKAACGQALFWGENDSNQDLVHHVPVDVGQSIVATLESERKSLMINAKAP